ncbi:MAG: Sua5/YciO/YrdC/YwlC family protein [Spirulina sp. DLM2.Bin59]|nr:MAG: Sua5/YciO/YrdC/YwlC family protein [Spirulina sp. DLM2.Bin59]
MASIPELLQKLASGGVISFPTDTVPALGTLPIHGEQIFHLKQRQPDKPLILLGAAWQDFAPYVAGTAAERREWEAIAQQYWPGPLTLVLPATDRVPATMNPQNPGTIGIRVPDQAFALELLRESQPLATTSANRSGQPPLTRFGEIQATFPTVAIPPREQFPPEQSWGSGQPSTVAQWTAAGWRILRQGSVTLDPLIKLIK